MRYDTQISFVKEDKAYNPQTSKHDRTITVQSLPGNVTDTGAAQQVQLFGRLMQHSKTVRVPDKPEIAWNYLKIAGDPIKYRFKSDVQVLHGYSVIVGEDNG